MMTESFWKKQRKAAMKQEKARTEYFVCVGKLCTGNPQLLVLCAPIKLRHANDISEMHASKTSASKTVLTDGLWHQRTARISLTGMGRGGCGRGNFTSHLPLRVMHGPVPTDCV